jgi:hypothetical protein
MKNFGRWIRSFNFVPSLRTAERIPGYDSSKADYLKWLNKINLLVEDNEENVRGAQELGIKCILIKKPWNKNGRPLKESLEEITKLLE